MPAVYTVFNGDGEVDFSVKVNYRFVGAGENLAVAVDVGKDAVVELSVLELLKKLFVERM